ncbi:hypothetical protein ADU90_01425 [Clostridium botulinum]|uniref:GxGYxYP putative glycoside hydrolase first N-terminal domain-containing protein n=1 Tax=Clostridium botulinum C/D str. DC5 TaxID=1443128 RepID=A0A0A0IG52_CLOBO|nr:hypothetical protein Z952_06035 [Clostridium botulinum C/D str. BKT75002]KEI08711.1 hypothetical protein Z954_00895 [Clostridium botulinum C/D str. BKT2873]KGM95702.1 hypothetical protein Z956_03950 [Clostridium botulinum D str. CCUG 7971]KGN00455.1 hypothetical protein Z955_03705 [Clostridium botulinum C/D str. DC5]KOC48050.1 hypothetical protein ADU88_08905 [Clostridium botulinum]OOV52543.1 hypothetical protein B1A66_03820 [Clostridium botulinum D/C]
MKKSKITLYSLTIALFTIIFLLMINILSIQFNNKLSPTSNITSSVSLNSNNLYRDSYYIKNSKRPTHLYVILQDSLLSSEKAMISTLQGIVNNHCTSQIYTLSSSEPDYKIWLND